VAEVPPEPVLLPGTGKVVDAGVAPAGGNAEHHHLADLTGAQQRQRAGDAQYLSADRARGVYRDEYRLSKRSLNDLLSIEQDVFQADTASITPRYDAWDAAVRYAAAADNLLDMLGIERSRTIGDTLPSL